MTDEKKSGTRFLSFSLGNEEYAIPLLCVKEVIAIPEVTPIPFTASYFLGIMNLRGQIISVIDLRTKLGIIPNNTAETAVIICDLAPLSLGIVVDSINSVAAPSSKEISDTPDIQSSRASEYIIGVYRKDNRLTLLLDLAKALSLEDFNTMKKHGKAHKEAA